VKSTIVTDNLKSNLLLFIVKVMNALCEFGGGKGLKCEVMEVLKVEMGFLQGSGECARKVKLKVLPAG